MTQVQLVDVGLKFGEFQALREVNATFDAGRIHGIVGRNGSGKTVLLKCICGLLDAYSGQITINGVDRRNRKALGASMGIIIEAPGFVAGYSGLTNLKFLADIRHQAGRQEIVQAMEMVGLDPKCKKHVEKYSLGMRQRLGIAQAIMENPDMLVLDEPMNGLDNAGVKDMRQLFKDLRGQGKTILLASHNPRDIEELCDTVSEMDGGVFTAKSGFAPDP